MIQKFLSLTLLQKLTVTIFLIGLIYILLPGPTSINNFSGMPGSVKSDLPGDTIQNPNISAYYSQYSRDYITKFYKNVYSKMLIWLPLPIITINHPPEEAYQYVRDQQRSTFLEEYIFPMRDSIFVNGYEPFVENYMKGRPVDRSYAGNYLRFGVNYYTSKTTLRFYPSNMIARLIAYLWICVAIIWIAKVIKKLPEV